MKLFIDTANIDEIRQAKEMGVLDGVTTNPSLIAKERKDFETCLREICEVVEGPVSAEVVSLDYAGMLHEARKLASLAANIVVKIPVTPDGIRAVRTLGEEGIRTNVTLVFSPLQALLAAKAGATFISPFVGRLDDIGEQGMNVIEDIVAIFDNYTFPTEVLVASVRHPLHVLEAALLGADIATIPFKVIQQLLHHPLTDLGLERFLADWRSVPPSTLFQR